MRRLFAGLLPDEVLTRRSKAIFTRPYFAGHVKEFAASWDGTGVPTRLADPEELRRIWQQERPDARTGLLLHAAWAASLRPEETVQQFNCRFE